MERERVELVVEKLVELVDIGFLLAAANGSVYRETRQDRGASTYRCAVKDERENTDRGSDAATVQCEIV